MTTTTADLSDAEASLVLAIEERDAARKAAEAHATEAIHARLLLAESQDAIRAMARLVERLHHEIEAVDNFGRQWAAQRDEQRARAEKAEALVRGLEIRLREALSRASSAENALDAARVSTGVA